MSFAFAKDTVRKGLDAHSAIGLVCCALLYLICATGTAVVLYEEWQRFEQPDAPEMTSIAPAAVQQGIENVLAAESDRDTTTISTCTCPPRHCRGPPSPPTRRPSMSTPMERSSCPRKTPGRIPARAALPAQPARRVRHDAGRSLRRDDRRAFDFGIVAHPRIFRDAFRLRARRRDDVATVDWHNRLAVWSLPFALALALTGAMIGLFYVSGGSMAASAYGGDSEAAIAPIFGAEAEPDLTPAPVADSVPALAHMAREYPDVTPYYVILHDPRTAGSTSRSSANTSPAHLWRILRLRTARRVSRHCRHGRRYGRPAAGRIHLQFAFRQLRRAAGQDRLYRVRPCADRGGRDRDVHLAEQARASGPPCAASGCRGGAWSMAFPLRWSRPSSRGSQSTAAPFVALFWSVLALPISRCCVSPSPGQGLPHRFAYLPSNRSGAPFGN